MQLAGEREFKDLFPDCEVGAMPLFGNLYDMEVFVAESLAEAEEKGPAKLIINRLNYDMVRRGDMLSTEDIVDLLAIDLVGIVPEDEKVIISTNRGSPISLDGNSQAGQAFRNIAKRTLGEDIPYLDLKTQGGFFSRLGRLIRQGGGE